MANVEFITCDWDGCNKEYAYRTKGFNLCSEHCGVFKDRRGYNMTTLNRLGNITNGFQGKFKKVLCVCSAGLLRSPTAAAVLSQEPYNFNTRAAGIHEEYALIPVDEVLVAWADEIVCMQSWQTAEVCNKFPEAKGKTITLNIPDEFAYRDPELIRLIRERYDSCA